MWAWGRTARCRADDGGEAGADRPGRRHPAHPGRRLAVRHPLDRRPRGPPEDHQGGPAHRPHPPLHPRLRARDRARRPGRVRRPGGPARRRLGQAGRGLARPGHRRPVRLLAARGGGGGDRGGPPAGRAGHRPLLRRGLAPRPGRGGHRLHRARDRPDRGHDPAVRLAGRRDRPDAGQHRDLPEPRGGRRGQVPRLVGPHAPPARAPLRHGAFRVRRGDPGVRRHGRRAARCRTAWSRRRSPSWPRPASRAVEALSATTWGAREWLGRPGLDGGSGGRPGGVRERSAGGRTGVGGAAAGGAERTGCRLT